MTLNIVKAVKSLRPLKLAISAPSGAGKTFTALSIASGLGKKILVIDTEKNSSTLYANEFEFDVLDLKERTVGSFSKILPEIIELKYDVVIIDSLSHFWESTLNYKSDLDMAGGNSYTNWGKITPVWTKFITSIVDFPIHTIATFRAKTDYVIEQNEKGKSAPRKVGMAPIFRDGAEYEFDIFANMDLSHNLIIEKTRFKELDSMVINQPDSKFGVKILELLK